MSRFLTIGRSRQCDIIIQNNNVSREHLRIYASGANYVIENLGRHGATLNGTVLPAGRTVVAPGADVLLAGSVPLPWAQIYAMLPLQGVHAQQPQPYAPQPEPYYPPQPQPYIPQPEPYSPAPQPEQEGLGCLMGGVCYLIPLVGFIIWATSKDKNPKKAKTALTVALISFGLSILSSIVTFFLMAILSF